MNIFPIRIDADYEAALTRIDGLAKSQNLKKSTS